MAARPFASNASTLACEFARFAESRAACSSARRNCALSELPLSAGVVALAVLLDDKLGPDDVAAIAARLARMDGTKPWTRATLRLIAKHPRIAASKLAAKLGRETLPFKVDVRKLKKLGLTQSFEVGYEVSPRGRAYLAQRRRR